MNEQEIIFEMLLEIQSALPSGVAVRTAGGDAGASPPLCIVEWDSIRLPYEAGHRSVAGLVEDQSGNPVGEEFHRYHQMEIDIEARAYDESDRDTWLSDVADAFLIYESYADLFDEDTFEWQVGEIQPRSNPQVEPDWYEGGVTIRFKYVSRAQRTVDPLAEIVEGENSAASADGVSVYVYEGDE